MREYADSIIRAPPDLLIINNGHLEAIAESMAREIRSPTTEPIDPPMKLKSIQAITNLLPSISPNATVIASETLFFL